MHAICQSYLRRRSLHKIWFESNRLREFGHKSLGYVDTFFHLVRLITFFPCEEEFAVPQCHLLKSNFVTHILILNLYRALLNVITSTRSIVHHNETSYKFFTYQTSRIMVDYTNEGGIVSLYIISNAWKPCSLISLP